MTILWIIKGILLKTIKDSIREIRIINDTYYDNESIDNSGFSTKTNYTFTNSVETNSTYFYSDKKNQSHTD